MYPCPSLGLKDKDEGTSIAMETNLKLGQTVLSMAVALWWQLLIPLLGLDGGTGTIHHTYQRRRLLGHLMSSDINCMDSEKRDQAHIGFSLPSLPDPTRTLDSLIGLWSSATRSDFKRDSSCGGNALFVRLSRRKPKVKIELGKR